MYAIILVNNLHSLLNKPWYIEGEYGRAMLPSLFNVLEGNTVFAKAENPNSLNFLSQTGMPIAMNGDAKPTSEDQYVVVMNFKSPIYKYDQDCGPSGTQTALKQLKNLERDPNVSGVVLDIDSGGGQVAGTAELYDAIKNYSKPVVAFTAGYMCSAAYYIGSAAQEVIASPRADCIGSIGVMMEYLDLKGYYEKLGAKVITEYATKSTKKNKAFRAAADGDLSLLIKEELDPIAEIFHKDMKSVRPSISEDALTGATYDGPTAIENGIVDRLGSLQDAIDKVFTLSRKQTNNNSINLNNKQMKTTDRPLLQAVLGLDSPLASLEDQSSLSNGDLDAIEAHLGTQATAISAAQDLQATAEAELETAETHETGLSASITALITENGIETEEGADANAQLEAVQGHITLLGSKAASHPATPRKDADASDENPIVDANASHNKIADNL